MGARRGPAEPSARAVPHLLAQDTELLALVTRYTTAARDAAQARRTLERLLAVCRPVAERIARSYAAHEADVADIVQDALVTLARDLPQLRRPTSFPPWFATLVHNRGRDWLRRRRTRQVELSLDAPPRPGWLGPGEGPQPFDLPDPDAARAFLEVEAGDQLAALLRLLPLQQRLALCMAYLEGRSHEEIGHTLRTSPRAVEGLIYRAMRRLQTITLQCSEEPEVFTRHCATCGRQPLMGYLRLNESHDQPLRLHATCPRCLPGYFDMIAFSVPLARYASLDQALDRGNAAVGPYLRGLAARPDPRCAGCGAVMIHRRWWESFHGDSQGSRPFVYWSCPGCGQWLRCGGHGLAMAAPDWVAFERATPRLMLDGQRLVAHAGVQCLVTTAHDADSGRQITLYQDWQTLRQQRIEITG
ncbi:MAG TPA: sigma-70 family RNA polymerase sigma factor [Chloroflexota bacterium]|jgi:RNA polymerase sigma factor (sigma-70 family)|nr:sigma-70 family RNA polymerase sigma factor [Chloroflexota bacterium]